MRERGNIEMICVKRSVFSFERETWPDISIGAVLVSW